MSGRSLSETSDMALTYVGYGEYELRAGPVVFDFSYDGSDYGVGDWSLMNIRIGGQRIYCGEIVQNGPMHDWLEAHGRGENGMLPDEPEEAD